MLGRQRLGEREGGLEAVCTHRHPHLERVEEFGVI
jgi:hypothetical protein